MRLPLIGALLLLSAVIPSRADEASSSPQPSTAYGPATHERLPPAKELSEAVQALPPPAEYAPVQPVPYTPGKAYSPPPQRNYAQWPNPVPLSPYTDSVKLDHLRSAIEHLEVAGATDMAGQVRQLLAHEIKLQNAQLLKQKQVQLAALHAEVERLRKAAGKDQMVQVMVKVYRLSLTKLRNLEIDSADFSGSSEPILERYLNAERLGKAPVGPDIVEHDHTLLRVVDVLQKEGVAEVISRPQIMTLDGQPARIQVMASVSSGPLQNSGADARTVGLELEIVPQVLDNERIRLSLDMKRSRLAEVQPSPNAPPAIVAEKFAADVELKSGQVLVLCGPARTSGEASATLLVARPTLVEEESYRPSPGQRR